MSISNLTPHSTTNNIVLGAIFLILAELCFAGVGATVKALSVDMSQSQLVFFRNASALVILLPLLLRKGLTGGVSLLKTERLELHLFRALCGMVAMYGFFYVLATLTLAQAMMALLLAPFIVPIIARFWLREVIDRKTMLAIVIGFVGVGIILLATEAILFIPPMIIIQSKTPKNKPVNNFGTANSVFITRAILLI